MILELYVLDVCSRQQQNRCNRIHCIVALFIDKVISRVNVKYQFAGFRNTVCNFVENWNVYNVLCKVENANNVIY